MHRSAYLIGLGILIILGTDGQIDRRLGEIQRIVSGQRNSRARKTERSKTGRGGKTESGHYMVNPCAIED